jgi:thymidine kinase
MNGFSENHYFNTGRIGSIEVICGSMFSGKTEELIRRMKRAQFAKQTVEIFKPALDTRFSEENIVSHDQTAIPCTPVEHSGNILLLSGSIDVVGIDEAQFFDDGLPQICNQLAEQGIRVIVAGLDMDYKGNPFGPMPALCSIADDVTKVHAICVECGRLAGYSHRLVNNEKLVFLGEKEEYQPLCRTCFNRHNI